jgi:S1-C subfamily serine protease
MSESDHNDSVEPGRDHDPDLTQQTPLDPTETLGAVGGAPAEPAAPADPAPWPQYSWPPTAHNPTAAQNPTAETPRAEGSGVPGSGEPTAPTPPSDQGFASWPPTQPAPAAGPYSANPYSGDPNAQTPGWGPPPAGWGAPNPGAWPPAAPMQPPAPPAPPAPRARRGIAVLAALALVLASAGVGAGVAVALHDNSKSRSFDSANTVPTIPSGNGGFVIPGTTVPGFGSTPATTPSGSGTLDMNAIAGKVDPALVNINTTLAQGRAAGTGMLISSSGEILTNNHVIADSTSIKVTVGGTGPTYTAKVVGYDVTEDVALLQITDKVSNLPTVTFGDPSKISVGDPVVAIGNALGKGGTPQATQGHVTALDQQVTAGDNQGQSETLEGMIQINAPIQPGDSGGALVDANARIIGMNTAAAGGGRFNAQASNIGFAIPIDNAVSIVSQIRTGTDTDKVHIGDRALLGVQVQDASGQNGPVDAGAFVVGVQDGTGASAVGMQQGDVLVSLNGKAIADQQALRNALYPFHPGDKVSVGWVDASGARHNADIKLIVGPPL